MLEGMEKYFFFPPSLIRNPPLFRWGVVLIIFKGKEEHGSKELNSILLEVADTVLFNWLLPTLCEWKVLTGGGNCFLITFLLNKKT